MLTFAELHESYDYANGNLFRRKATKGYAAGTRIGYQKEDGRWRTVIGARRYYLHRLIFQWFHGYVPSEVDHVNGDHTDNRVENLRACSRSENQRNTGLRSSNKSGVKGVHSAPGGTWIAMVASDEGRKYLGVFKDLKEAEAVVREYRQELHGEFTRHR